MGGALADHFDLCAILGFLDQAVEAEIEAILENPMNSSDSAPWSKKPAGGAALLTS